MLAPLHIVVVPCQAVDFSLGALDPLDGSIELWERIAGRYFLQVMREKGEWCIEVSDLVLFLSEFKQAGELLKCVCVAVHQ